MKGESQRQRMQRCLKEVEEHPDRASAYYNLGLAYTVSGRVKQAEDAYVRAVELDPGMTKAWVNLGGVRMLHWDFEGCLEANQKAAALQGDLVEAHYNMGQAYLYLNDPENLLRCNKKVLELEPDHAAGHYYAAVGYLVTDDLGAAERHMGRAMELGHAPTQDFVKAIEKARAKKQRDNRATLIEIAGSEDPERPKEE